jgi:hypothetical protein
MRIALLILYALLVNIGFITTSYASSFFELYLNLENQYLEFYEPFSGSQYGSSLAYGDLNGDGLSDIIIGAPFASLNAKKWNGMVSVIFGGNNSKLKFTGESSGDQLGSSVTVGDYNNDGIDDIALGAYNAYHEDERKGKVYVIYGKSTWSSQSFDFAFYKPDVELTGDLSNSSFGLSLTSGDVNNDQIDDLVIGAPFNKNPEGNLSGSVYSFFGSNNGLSKLFGSIYNGQNEGDRFGASLAIGDLNGDFMNELAIGAYLLDSKSSNVGAVYVYDYDSKGIVPFNSASYILTGSSEDSWFGFSISAGDVNSDSIDDLLVSSFPFSGDKSKNSLTAYFGGEKFGLLPAFEIKNSFEDILLGSCVKIADLDLDGINEIIIGAPGIGPSQSENEGNVYVIYGRHLLDELTYSNSLIIENMDSISLIHGLNPDDWFGNDLAVLDFNNDGFLDILVGSRYSDSKTSVNDGSAYLIFGNGQPFGTLKNIQSYNNQVNRGDFISEIIYRFDIKNKKESLIQKCYDFREFCLFNFTAMSSYDDITLEPEIILYPDIQPSSEYYEDVLLSTMLGIMNGYISEENSPFHPDRPVSRIQALKVILSAADLVVPKYRFELIDILGSLENLTNQKSYFIDVDPKISHMWWYPRYVNFAVENNIIEESDFFRPDENITKEELNDMIENVISFINSSENEEIDLSGDSAN